MKQFAPITIHTDDIKKTKAFASLSIVLQKITLKRNSRLAIQHSVNVAKNIGFDNWLQQTQTKPHRIDLIQELLKTKTS